MRFQNKYSKDYRYIFFRNKKLNIKEIIKRELLSDGNMKKWDIDKITSDDFLYSEFSLYISDIFFDIDLKDFHTTFLVYTVDGVDYQINCLYYLLDLIHSMNYDHRVSIMMHTKMIELFGNEKISYVAYYHHDEIQTAISTVCLKNFQTHVWVEDGHENEDLCMVVA